MRLPIPLEQIAVLGALLALSWQSGVVISRLRLPGPVIAPSRAVALAGAAALALAWGVAAGALIAGRWSAVVPLPESLLDAPAVTWRIAALWATLPGSLTTLALLFAIGAALLRDHSARSARAVVRWELYTSVAAMLSIAAAISFSSTAPSAAELPPQMVHGAAALASAAAIAGAGLLCLQLLGWLAARQEGSAPSPRERYLALAAWLLATLALGAEQAARQAMGLGPDTAVVLGSPVAGLVLWLAAAGELYRQLAAPRNQKYRTGAARWGLHITTAGAALIILSFAAHVAARRENVRLAPGSSVEVKQPFGGAWRLTGSGVSRFDAEGLETVAAAVVAARDDSERLLVPELRQYLTSTGEPLGPPLARTATLRTVAGDLRLLVSNIEAGDTVYLRVSFVPLAALWQLGLIAALGGPLLLGAMSGAEPTVQREVARWRG